MSYFERLFVNNLRTKDRIYDAQREDSSLLSGITAQRARCFTGSFVALSFSEYFHQVLFLFLVCLQAGRSDLIILFY